MPASSEFIALCQSQVALLTSGLGAALSIVYLTEELVDVTDAKLVPIAAYPESALQWKEEQIFSLLFQEPSQSSANPRLLSSESAIDLVNPESMSAATALPPAASELEADRQPMQIVEKALLRQQQVVLPLMHQDVVMGLLVTARADRPWNESEQTQIEQIADTLTLACLLDQRAQWLAQDARQQHLLREQKHDLFDNLLHQFRNPLTALRTFGKLLVKRLQPGDANRSVAEGIVRESDRLQELLQQFDAAIDLDEIGLRRLLNASADDEPDQESATTLQDRLQDKLPSRFQDQSDFSYSGSENISQSFPPSLPHSSAPPPLLPSANRLVGALTLLPGFVTEVLEPLLETAIAIAQDRQLTLHVVIPTDLPAVEMDARALREVLNNLVDNALKYTPTGGEIQVEVQSQPLPDRPHQQAIIIADTGPGIPPQDLDHLFERHYRGVQAATEIPGTGLGLAIARELIHQMHGEIQVFSPAHTNPLVQPTFDASVSHQPGTAVIVWLPEERSGRV